MLPLYGSKKEFAMPDIESPLRRELLRSFATRFQPILTWDEIEDRFDDFMKHGYIDARRDPLTGQWECHPV